MNQATGRDGAGGCGTRICIGCVALLLGVHASLLAYSATCHSPTINEPAHLVAGICHWKHGRFDIYRINPPLVHYVAAIPAIMSGCNEDWSALVDLPDSRSEFQVGDDFIKANGERSIWLFTIARWACIPFSLIGGVCCFLWSRDLWESNFAGLISLFLWCFDPNILAHGELINSDCAAASLGLAACYCFWRWLHQPYWGRAIFAGLVLGLAVLTKATWVILFGLWPLVWVIAELSNRRMTLQSGSQPQIIRRVLMSSIRRSCQMLVIFVLGLYVLNLGYGFDGSFSKVKEFTFVSKTLTGLNKPGEMGNRFAKSWIGEIYLPVPMQFIRGIDLQKREFENDERPSYLRGTWQRGGWWYYYLYGLTVKTPLGSQLAILLAIISATCRVQSGAGLCSSRDPKVSLAQAEKIGHKRVTTRESALGGTYIELLTLLLPAFAILVIASIQTQSNHHIRYVLPVLGFAHVFAGANSDWFLRPSTEKRMNLPMDLPKKSGREERDQTACSNIMGDRYPKVECLRRVL